MPDSITKNTMRDAAFSRKSSQRVLIAVEGINLSVSPIKKHIK